jgi:hypothetical protein
MAGSPTQVVNNEWGKKETRHVEIEDVEQSPLRGLKLEIKMNDVYAAGYKIQPKIDVPKPEQTAEQLSPEISEPTETPEQRDARKRVEHLNERTGRIEPIFRKTLPAVIDTEAKCVKNAGKFILKMPVSSTMDSDLKRRNAELTEYTEEVLGTPETADNKQKLFISDPVVSGQTKSVVVVFTGFDDENKKVSAALKGTIQDSFYKQQFDIGRTFLVSDTELNSAISRYGTDASKQSMMLPDPRKERLAKGEKLDESLDKSLQNTDDIQDDGKDGKGSHDGNGGLGD